MCAMLSLIVPNELKIGTRRALRFVESYVGKCAPCHSSDSRLSMKAELLMRMRLHCEAAYIRKHAEAEDLRNRTAVSSLCTLMQILAAHCLIGRDNDPYCLPEVWQEPARSTASGDRLGRYAKWKFCLLQILPHSCHDLFDMVSEYLVTHVSSR